MSISKCSILAPRRSEKVFIDIQEGCIISHIIHPNNKIVNSQSVGRTGEVSVIRELRGASYTVRDVHNKARCGDIAIETKWGDILGEIKNTTKSFNKLSKKLVDKFREDVSINRSPVSALFALNYVYIHNVPTKHVYITIDSIDTTTKSLIVYVINPTADEIVYTGAICSILMEMASWLNSWKAGIEILRKCVRKLIVLSNKHDNISETFKLTLAIKHDLINYRYDGVCPPNIDVYDGSEFLIYDKEDITNII